MKYNIVINQKALTELAPELDIVDAAIIDYLYTICNSKSAEIARMRLKYKGHDWTWADYASLANEMPLLKINPQSTAALSRYIKKIEASGFIKTHRLHHQKLFVHMTALTDKLFISDPSFYRELGSTSPRARTQKSQSWDRNETYYTTSNHSTSDHGGVPKKKIKDDNKDSTPETHLAYFQAKYPEKNVANELAKAYAWLQASGKKYKNYQQFYNYWLLKADSQGGNRGRNQSIDLSHIT